MTVYYITIVLVLLLGTAANQADFDRDGTLSYSRIRHTGRTRRFYILAAAVLILVAGLRYYVGTDYGAYYKIYGDFADAFWRNVRRLNEPGYGLISKIAIWIHDDGATAVFLASLVTVGLYLTVIYRNTDRLLPALLLFIFLECWHESFNAVRQCLAAAVLFCGFPYLRDRRLIPYAIVVFLAFLCHKSAIVMILPYFLMHQKTRPLNILLLAVATVVVLHSYDVLFAIQDEILQDGIIQYGYVTSAVNILRVLAYCAPAVLFLVFKPKESEESDFYLNLLLLHAVVAVSSANSTYLARMTIYTAPFVAIAIPELMKTMPSNRRKLLLRVTILLFGIFCLYDISINGSLNHFQWIWERGNTVV